MDVARQTALALLETVLSKRHAFDESFARAVEPLHDIGDGDALARMVGGDLQKQFGQLRAARPRVVGLGPRYGMGIGGIGRRIVAHGSQPYQIDPALSAPASAKCS